MIAPLGLSNLRKPLVRLVGSRRYSNIFAVASSLAVFSFARFVMVEAMSIWNQAGVVAVMNVAANWVAWTTHKIAPALITDVTIEPVSSA